MPFKITFEPLNRIKGVTPTTAEVETAARAWLEVHGLQMSDEKVTEIITPDGRRISWEELRDLALTEKN
jgi:hypothetical protein